MLCGQDILLIIYDQEFQKVYQYRSDEAFDIARAKELLDMGCSAASGKGARRRRQQAAATVKVFDYSNKDLKKFAKDDKDSDAEDGLDFGEEAEENRESEDQPEDSVVLPSSSPVPEPTAAPDPVPIKEEAADTTEKVKEKGALPNSLVGSKRKYSEAAQVNK